MKTHPLNLSSLLFGLVFLGVVAGWSLYELDLVTAAALMWLLPLLLICAGIAGIALSATKSLRAPNNEHEYSPEVSNESDRTETLTEEPDND